MTAEAGILAADEQLLSGEPSAYGDGTELYADLLRHLDARLAHLLQHSTARLGGQESHLFPGLVVTETEVRHLLDPPSPEETAGHGRESFHGLWEQVEASVARSREQGAAFPLDLLRRRHELTNHEVDCLIACLAVEIDRKYERLYAYLNDDMACRHPSVGLLIQLFARADDESLDLQRQLSKQSALLRGRLLEPLDGVEGQKRSTTLGTCLRLDEGVAGFLLETEPPFSSLDRVWDYPSQPPEAVTLWESSLLNTRVEKLLDGYFETPQARVEPLVCSLLGREGSGRRYAIEVACAQHDLGVATISCRRLADEPDGDVILQRAFRDSVLQSAPLVLTDAEVLSEAGDGPARLHRLLPRLLEAQGWLLFLTAEAPADLATCFRRSRYVEIRADNSTLRDRSRHWTGLIETGLSLERETARQVAEALAAKFQLTPGQIAEAFHLTLSDLVMGGDSTDVVALLHQHASRLAAPSLGRLAKRLRPVYTWDDIVLRDSKAELLRDIVRHVRHRQKVMEDWAFETKLSRGKGISVLFHGPSGAGKTMAAEVIANELGMDLYRIDLAAVVSKYVGETEKNLGRIFDEARSSDAVLLFDEADALFGKRSEVRDAHDRYANIEINYLLQRMEEFEGIAILASNLRQNLDEAFLRRLRLVVEFPLPGPRERQHIWRKVLPKQAAVAPDVDFHFLGKNFDLTGGSIRNVALAGAFMAADAGTDIGMRHLLQAMEKELEKLGRRAFRQQFGSYAELIEADQPAVGTE